MKMAELLPLQVYMFTLNLAEFIYLGHFYCNPVTKDDVVIVKFFFIHQDIVEVYANVWIF